MTYEPTGSDRRAELIDVIHRVRNRWRLKLALRGAVIVVAGTLLALFLSASSLEALRFSPTAIITFRILALLVFAALVAVGFVQPLRRRVTDSQVALYLEEKDPTLEAAILSAIESSSLHQRENIDPNHRPSPHLVEKLVDQAIEKCRALENGLAIERAGLKRQLYRARRRGRRRRADHHVRSGIPAQRHVGAADRLRAARKPPAPTRSRSRRATRRFRAAPIRRSRRSCWASPRQTPR